MKRLILILFSITFILFFGIAIIFNLHDFGHKKHSQKIRFSSWGSESEIAFIKPLLDEFEKQNPDIKVEFIHIPKNYFQKLHLLVASNLTPDAVFINNLNLPLYAENNVFMDLTGFLSAKSFTLTPYPIHGMRKRFAEGEPPYQLGSRLFSPQDFYLTKNTFFKEALDSLSYKGKLYAIPRDVSNLVIYYNKDIFDKYNVPYPDKSWTYDDFLQTCLKLTKDLNNDGKTEQFGVSFEEAPLFWLPWLWSNDGGFISKNLDSVIINKPESIEALQFYADLRNKYHAAPSKSEAGSATMAQLFIQQKIAMHISGRWSTPRYRKDIHFRWDIAKFPRGKAGSIVDCDASGWAISSASRHPKEAWRLIKFLASRKAAENFAKSGLIVPARIDAAKSDSFLDKKLPPESSNIFVDIIPDSMPTPVTENYQELTDVLNTAFEPLWNGQKNAKEVVNKDLVIQLNKKLNK